MSTPPGRFRDLHLKATYQAHDDRLGQFFIPTLRLAIAYDRLVGYWRSSTLVVAAAGLPHFISNALQHGGRMRIITGAELTEHDVNAIRGGAPLDDVVVRRLLDHPDEATDIIAADRMRIVAWMVREGMLEIKIGVPLGPDGTPMPPNEADRLFHTKYGILTDSSGDRIVFEGSLNESAKGWRHNHEAFSAYPSWRTEVWEGWGRPWVDAFERHWDDPHPVHGWAILDFPDALKANLLTLVDDDWVPPVKDPVETQTDHDVEFDAARRELQRLRNAPREAGGTGVGFVTLPIKPWPHQSSIAGKVLASWPRSYLFADEVGLGKTIEAGLVIRELLLTGNADRILLLVPASVQRQWQEELWEKFCLNVPSYTGGKFIDVHGDKVDAPVGLNPWSAFPVVLASSHLARMRGRRGQILDAAPWDLVLVDEAHHARRRGIAGGEGANQLLQLLRDLRDADAWRALLLATATPMQMNTTELFDLLDLFGLPGRWGQSANQFEAYYRHVAEPDPKRRDWDLLRGMLADFLTQTDGNPNPVVLDQLRRELPGPARMRIERFHQLPIPASQVVTLPSEQRRLLDAWLRANTPMRDRVFRTSREALREYQHLGILDESATIPRRRIEDRRIAFASETETELYRRIENYITRYYEAYNHDKATKPLGFIMTVYRRRLTSSLYAVHKSLQRRLHGLQDQAALETLVDDDDRYTLESTVGFEPDQLTSAGVALADEIAELDSFLGELEAAIPTDTKVQQLVDDIHAAFTGGHKTILVFTQYTDTLEWLRDQLKATYKGQVACYTGAGGSRWNEQKQRWEPLPKAEVKELFRAGDQVKILLGTDAMSEGLNLQTCDRLINYDMPWNFMRVEQRIGRIDRIGGRPLVTITNYFYKDTVEDQVYTGIQEDADWFNQVVGPAQPVLSQVETVIQSVAMRTSEEARRTALQQELAEVRQAIHDAQQRPVTLDDMESRDLATIGGYASVPAITLDQIEQVLTTNPLTRDRMHPHPDFDHTYLAETADGKHPVTFDRDVYDHNPDIHFMTYREPVFETVLDNVLGSS